MFPLDYKKLGLVLYPHEILRRACNDVPAEALKTDELYKFCDFMKKIAKKYDGIGLAAPQVGVDARMILIAPSKKEQFFLINPVIVDSSKEKVLDSEGCLSLPDIYGTVIRPEAVTVQAYNEYGEKVEISADKMLARIIQHEIDHINGELFIDKVVTITGGKDRLENLRNKARDNER